MYDRRSQRSQPFAPIIASDVTATVKWFNPTKGFGFATPEDGSPDAFLHASVIQAAGYDSLAEGATIVCDLAQGQKGPQVSAIHSVRTDTATAPRRDSDGSRGGAYDRPDAGGWASHGGGDPVAGTVKWFNAEKGFGFIAPDHGGTDIFVHIRAVERSGLHTLNPDERVSVTVREGPKGPQAERIERL